VHEKTKSHALREKGECLSRFLPKTVVPSDPLKISRNPSGQTPGLAGRSSRYQKADYHQQDGHNPGGNNLNQLMRAVSAIQHYRDASFAIRNYQLAIIAWRPALYATAFPISAFHLGQVPKVIKACPFQATQGSPGRSESLAQL
jgi:hypothetical protein